MPTKNRRGCKPKPTEVPEPSVADLLSGSVVQAVMKADGIDPNEFVAILRRVAAIRAQRRSGAS